MSKAKGFDLDLDGLQEEVLEKWRSRIKIRRSMSDQSHCSGSEDQAKVICLTNVDEPVEVLDMVIGNKVSNLCQSSHKQLSEELNTSAKMIFEPTEFVANPLSSILSPQTANADHERILTHFLYDFDSATQKTEALEQLKTYLETISKSESFHSDILSAADELFTNAVFNAPFIDPNTNENLGKDRTDSSTKMEKGSAQLFAGTHDNRLVLGCRDPYGTLQLDSLVKKIRKVYKDGVGQSINMGPGGAGIGSYLVFNTGTSYYVGVIEGQATVVCFSVPLKMSSRKREQMPKNVHFFEVKQEET